MRTIVAAAIALIPAVSAAQRGIPVVAATEVVPGGQKVIPSPPVPKNPAGKDSPLVGATIAMNDVRSRCTVIENDGKLFAICNNSTRSAKILGATYLPQTDDEWVWFARRLADADFTINGVKRSVVVLNKDDVIAETRAGDPVKLKK